MDRLTQIQQCAEKISEHFFTSVGVLQRDAPLMETNPNIPVTCWTPEQIKNNWQGNSELAISAAHDIVQTAKVIDFLIENLPGIEQSEEEQVSIKLTR
jgi:mediator of RNA polymerase II transcription subunit 21